MCVTVLLPSQEETKGQYAYLGLAVGCRRGVGIGLAGGDIDFSSQDGENFVLQEVGRVGIMI